MIRDNFESLPSMHLDAVLVYMINLQYTEIQFLEKTRMPWTTKTITERTRHAYAQSSSSW